MDRSLCAFIRCFPSSIFCLFDKHSSRSPEPHAQAPWVPDIAEHIFNFSVFEVHWLFSMDDSIAAGE